MPKTNDAWGIEVGANAIKAMHLVRQGGQVRIADFRIIPFKPILTTPDLHVDEAIQVGLDQLLNEFPKINSSTVMVSVPGHSAFARFAKLPPVEPKKIPDIVRFEAMQQIPFPIEQVEWDYQIFAQEDSPDVEVGIFAITKDRVADFLTNYEAVGLRVDGLTLSPVAVYNAMHYDMGLDESGDGTIFMDIGTTSTDLIIVNEGQLWLRTLPIGGNNFTEALVSAFKLSFNKAEYKLKREAGTSKYARQIFQAMRPVFADLVQEMQRSLGYYQSMNRDAKLTRIVGVGSTFRLPGMTKFLKQQLQMDVLRPDGFKRLEVEGKQEAELADNALNFATAYGLALQGLGAERVSANILPTHIVKQRLWKAKQPWIAAAAVLLALSSGYAYMTMRAADSTFHSSIAQTQPKVDATLRMSSRFEEQWNQIARQEDPRQRIENRRRMLDYRDVWPKIMADIDTALASMNSPEPLFDADYNVIANIPRRERHRLYIDSIEVEYQSIAGMVQQGRSYEAQPSASMWNAASAAEQQPQQVQPQAQRPVLVPTFVIRLKGYAPMGRDAREWINRTFVATLKQNAQRPDRPYRHVIVDQEILARAVERRAQVGVPGAGAPGVGVGVGVQPGAGPAQPGRPQQSQAGAFREFLPTRPLQGEPDGDDLLIELTWSVQLIEPSKARQLERGETSAATAAEATGGEGRL